MSSPRASTWETGRGGPLLSAFAFAIGGTSVLALVLLPALRPGALVKVIRGAPPPQPTMHVAPAGCRPPPAFSARVFRYVSLYAGVRALGTMAAAGLGWGLGLAYPLWAAQTVVACARPTRDLTIIATARNVVGTLLGASLAHLLVANIHDRAALLLLIMALVFAALTTKDLNYAIFTFFISGMSLLLISFGTGRPLEGLRVFHSVAAAGIIVAVTLVVAVLTRRAATTTMDRVRD